MYQVWCSVFKAYMLDWRKGQPVICICALCYI